MTLLNEYNPRVENVDEGLIEIGWYDERGERHAITHHKTTPELARKAWGWGERQILEHLHILR